MVHLQRLPNQFVFITTRTESLKKSPPRRLDG